MVSEINGYMSADDNNKNVLILVLVEDGLGALCCMPRIAVTSLVLILVLVEDGLGVDHCASKRGFLVMS